MFEEDVKIAESVIIWSMWLIQIVAFILMFVILYKDDGADRVRE